MALFFQSFLSMHFLLAALGAFLLGIAKSGVKGIAVFIVILFVFAFDAKASTGILMPLLIGVDNFDAVINPPHGAILAVGRGLKKPVVNDDDSISVANLMSLTLSVDHRVIDGALGAELLGSITKYLEDPILMLT